VRRPAIESRQLPVHSLRLMQHGLSAAHRKVEEAGPLGLAWTDCAAGPTASSFEANALRLPVDVAAFGDDEYGHFSCSIVNAVHDPVLTKPHPPIISASNEFLRSRRARIMRQTDDRL